MAAPVIEQILVDIKSTANLNALKQTREVVQQLAEVGVVGAKGAVKGINRQMKEVASNSKNAARALMPFRMELLGVMFGARMVSDAFLGLLRPAFEMVGIFDILGTSLAVLFLPTAEAVLDWVLRFADFIMSLPQPVQQLIGAVVGMFAAFFAFIATEAALGLFFDSFVKSIANVNVELGKFVKFAGVVVALDGIIRFSKGDFVVGLAKMLEGVGMVLGGRIGGTLIASGLVLEVVGLLKKEDVDMFDALNLAFFGAIGARAFGFSPLVGGGVGLLIWVVIKGIKMSDEAKDTWVGAIDNLINIFTLRWSQVKVGGRSIKSMGLGIQSPVSGQTGIPFVPHTGLYKLHRGERVTQSEEIMNFSPTINIMGGSGMDARAVANMVKSELNQQWASELGRLVRR